MIWELLSFLFIDLSKTALSKTHKNYLGSPRPGKGALFTWLGSNKIQFIWKWPVKMGLMLGGRRLVELLLIMSLCSKHCENKIVNLI